ncbi:uncharacterized protein LOC108624905 [Ceratina calcarata]|uniref:Uncharacterized protein LOC108624905 n=1 Tax=Ceratina calcarata TaxID=156304 RepID=A0AAJ7IYG8_9HYME|nr:uncharacterized protein LOC108624905 [Ceratina calcarata]
MKDVAVFALLICYLINNGIAYDDLDDDYFREYVRNLIQKHTYTDVLRRDVYEGLESWTGRWMPDRLNDPTPPPKVFPKTENAKDQGSMHDIHGIAMGHPSVNCDDAKTNLTMDWDGDPIDYICYNQRITPSRDKIAIKYCEHISEHYVAMHKCMYEKIEYSDSIPVFGTHRPLWPVYGEYQFLPKQRWLHSLEHGAIVMLYHPCANPLEVNSLKTLLRGCLRRHIISPYNMLDEHRPLALVAWGCRLTMSYVDPKVVIEFIRDHALRGPENISRDGDFSDGLLHQANIVTDFEDSVLCPRIDV